MLKSLSRDKFSLAALIFFFVLSLWWLFINLIPTSDFNKYIFGAVYGPFMSLYGGVVGLYVSKQWGSLRSVMGKAIIFLSLGLLAESFGQLANSAYNVILHVETVYPGIADIGYFGNIPLYIAGIFFLAHVSGVRFNLRSVTSAAFAFLIPCLLLATSYFFFLRNYQFDWAQPLTIFLDFGYPLGQALYISLAVITYMLSKNLLGGMMKKIILMIVAGFVIQYLADFSFLYTNSHNQYFVGGFVDYLYLLSYTIMVLSLLELRQAAIKIRTPDITYPNK